MSFYGILAGVLFREIHLPSFSMLGSVGVWLLAAGAGTVVDLLSTPGKSWGILDLQFAASVPASVFMFLSIAVSFGAQRTAYELLPDGAPEDADELPASFSTGAIRRRISTENINYFLIPLNVFNLLMCLASMGLAIAMTATKQSDAPASLFTISPLLTIAAAALGIVVAVSALYCRLKRIIRPFLKLLWVYASYISLWLFATAAGTLANEMFKPVYDPSLQTTLFDTTFVFQILSAVGWIVGIAIFSVA